MTLFQELRHLLKKNIREYGMYIALLVIVIAFGWQLTGFLFHPETSVPFKSDRLHYGTCCWYDSDYSLSVHRPSVGYLAGFSGR